MHATTRLWFLIVTLLAVSALFGGCANPYEHQLPSKMEDWDKDEELKAALEKLPQEDRQLVAAYMMRAGLSEAFGGEGMPPATTIREAIEAQKAWQAEQKRKEEEEKRQQAEQEALAQKLQQEREAKAREMNDALTVTVTRLKHVPADIMAGRIQDVISLTVAFQNKTARPMTGVKGTLQFNDVFGDRIQRVGVSYDEGVPANAVATWKAQIEYNQFMAEDKKLATTPLEKLQIAWEPDTILFEDGTKLTVE